MHFFRKDGYDRLKNQKGLKQDRGVAAERAGPERLILKAAPALVNEFIL